MKNIFPILLTVLFSSILSGSTALANPGKEIDISKMTLAELDQRCDDAKFLPC